jgi:hypothetical protein
VTTDDGDEHAESGCEDERLRSDAHVHTTFP